MSEESRERRETGERGGRGGERGEATEEAEWPRRCSRPWLEDASEWDEAMVKVNCERHQLGMAGWGGLVVKSEAGSRE